MSLKRSKLLHRTQFFTTVNHLRDLPPSSLPEVAFIGRSNAGKSSAINVLCQQKRLAFASKTPGRTQHLNYFSVGPTDALTGYLVDLPGYGYATAPQEAKGHWERLVAQYLQTRPQLRGLVMLMDARHPCTELDRQMLKWWAGTERPLHILLTKADKLTRQQSVLVLRQTQDQLSEYAATGLMTIQLFSALKRTGLEEAHEIIESWFLPTPAVASD